MRPRSSCWSAVSLLAVVSLTAPATLAGVAVGDQGGAFVLSDASGRPVTLASFRGQIVILDFTASWCVACRRALPELETLGRRYADRGVVVVTVVLDASRGDAERFLAEVVPDPTMHVLYDPTGRTLASYGASGMPAHYVLDRRGVAQLVASGYTDDRMAAIESVVTRLLAADSVPAAPARAPRVE